MADAATPGNDVQVAPPDAEFKGPFSASTKSVHTLTNTSATRICIKVKVFDENVVQCKPSCTFLTPGEQIPLNLHHKSFPFNKSESYDKRKVGIYYVEAPDAATDPIALAKETPAANWKVMKMPIKYNAG